MKPRSHASLRRGLVPRRAFARHVNLDAPNALSVWADGGVRARGRPFGWTARGPDTCTSSAPPTPEEAAGPSCFSDRARRSAPSRRRPLLVRFFLFLGVLVDDLLREVLRHLFVVRELQRERAAAAGQ